MMRQQQPAKIIGARLAKKAEIILQRRATLANTSATVGNTGEAVEGRGRAKEAIGGTDVR